MKRTGNKNCGYNDTDTYSDDRRHRPRKQCPHESVPHCPKLSGSLVSYMLEKKTSAGHLVSLFYVPGNVHKFQKFPI